MNRRQLLQLTGLSALAATLGLGMRNAHAGNRYYSGPVTDHFDGMRFFNPAGEQPRALTDVLRWRLRGDRATWPDMVRSPFPSATPDAQVEDLRITMVGHATMLIQVAGLNILTDPVWSERASPVRFAGPKRVLSPGIAFGALPRIDLILLSHNHYDHLDVETLRQLHAGHDPLVVTPLGNDTILADSVPGMRVMAGDWGDRIDVNDRMTVHIEPAHHWSARGMRDRRMALWASFVVETPSGRIYHIGDTGFHDGINYRQASAKHRSFRLAVLPIGAYEPRWFMKGQHQGPEEAVEGMMLANAAFAVGHHWSTFQLTDEPIDAPRQALLAALAARDIPVERFRPMLAGQSWDVPLRA